MYNVTPWRVRLMFILPWIFLQPGSGVPRVGWGSTPPPEIPKALQNRAKLNPIVKTVKNC